MCVPGECLETLLFIGLVTEAIDWHVLAPKNPRKIFHVKGREETGISVCWHHLNPLQCFWLKKKILRSSEYYEWKAFKLFSLLRAVNMRLELQDWENRTCCKSLLLVLLIQNDMWICRKTTYFCFLKQIWYSSCIRINPWVTEGLKANFDSKLPFNYC